MKFRAFEREFRAKMLKFWAIEMKFWGKFSKFFGKKELNLMLNLGIFKNFKAFFAALFFKAAQMPIFTAQKPIFKAARNSTTRLNLSLNLAENLNFSRQNPC